MRQLCTTILALSIAIGLSGCGNESSTPQQTTDARNRPGLPDPAAQQQPAPGVPPESASAQLAATQGNTAAGMLAITRADGGVRVAGSIQGLKPDSEFGFHIHEKGDCSAPDASSAGGHFNPDNQPHGDPTGDAHHAGDMLNIKSNADGVAEVDVTVQNVTLHTGQPNDVLGKGVVVHAGPDDYKSQPAGNSGARIACGVITVTADNAANAAPAAADQPTG